MTASIGATIAAVNVVLNSIGNGGPPRRCFECDNTNCPGGEIHRTPKTDWLKRLRFWR